MLLSVHLHAEASPHMANLAGKILVSPALTPTQVIEIIVSTAEKTSDGDQGLAGGNSSPCRS